MAVGSVPAREHVQVEDDGSSLALVGARGRALLSYGDLTVTDATGHRLRANIHSADGSMLLAVDDAGARYPITIDPIVQQAELISGDGAAYSELGAAVATSGSTIVVSAPNQAVGSQSAQGVVYVFSDNSGAWKESAELTSADGQAGDSFGSSVAISGSTIAVGAHNVRSGTGLYVFSDDSGMWQQEAELGAFGGCCTGVTSLALSKDTLVVGDSGVTFVFSNASGSWQQTAKLTVPGGAVGASFGQSVALSGSTIVVGSPDQTIGSNQYEGAAYVFSDVSGSWQQIGELTASDGAPEEFVGDSVAVLGSTVLVGSQGYGVYVYSETSGVWQQDAQLTAGPLAGTGAGFFGSSLAVSDGVIVVGAPWSSLTASLQGAAFVFSDTSGAWQQVGELTAADAGASDQFGAVVAVSGGTIVVGAPFHTVGTNAWQGAAYVFGGVALAGIPASSGPPLISGSAVGGQTLNESSGSWTNAPSTYQYQWERCDSTGSYCSWIANATNQQYTLSAPDVGHTIRVQETALNAIGYSDPSSSAATDVVSAQAVPVNTLLPSISGSAVQGLTLSESLGSWTNGPSSYTYQWEDCDIAGANCSPIANAIGQTYVLGAADVGHEIRVQETASNAGSVGVPASSAATAPVAAQPFPANTRIPSILGSFIEGATLSEAHGSWTNGPSSYAYAWEDCDSSGANCSAIQGATGQTYVLGAADVGHEIRVQETASDAAGAGDSATSGATPIVAALPAPVSTGSPSISGTAMQGQTLSESHGVWLNSPSSYAYEWEDCDGLGANCSAISGATGQSYVLAASDVGYTVRVLETGSNAGGMGVAATSAATGVVAAMAVPVSTGSPSISGTAMQGQTLSESHGVWLNSPSSYAYEWEDCDSLGANCSPIAGATAQTYVPTASDVGYTVRVLETASNAGGPGSSASSSATSVVKQAVPAVTVSPSISGTATQGETLSESHGSWSNSPSSYAYEWEDCDSSGANCSAIQGATGQAYVLAASDVGYTVRVLETASNAGGTGVAATSSATAVVASMSVPLSMGSPSISGTAMQGETLSESHGVWLNSPSFYAYEWEDCDSLERTVLRSRVRRLRAMCLAASDVGYTVRVLETASNAGGPGSSASSSATSVVKQAVPAMTGSPSISGTATQGETLSESHGSWLNSPSSYAYAWEDCDSSGANCSAIQGATGQAYVLAASDVGYTVRVQETASNGGGSGSSASSSATSVVKQAVPAMTGSPSISGTATQGETLSESHGSWLNSPSSYAYEWEDCDSSGANCSAIQGATGQSVRAGGVGCGVHRSGAGDRVERRGIGQCGDSSATGWSRKWRFRL